jgi:hypothetical protein
MPLPSTAPPPPNSADPLMIRRTAGLDQALAGILVSRFCMAPSLEVASSL